MTGTSTLDPDNFPEAPDRSLGKGHGVDSLGPSDISDTGSDVVGGPGFAANLDLGKEWWVGRSAEWGLGGALRFSNYNAPVEIARLESRVSAFDIGLVFGATYN